MNQAILQTSLRERISALADGALEAESAQAVLDELLASPEGRAFWDDLHATGDFLRSEETGSCASPEGFMERFRERLAVEPVAFAPRALQQGRARGWLRYGLPGASIAAGVAMVLWMAIPQMTKPDAEVAAATPVVDAPQSKPVVAEAPAAPAAAVPANVRMDPELVGEYLTAHQGSVQAASLTIVPNKADSRP
ncbi:MAG: sigma-E factor negative regulatory protein [Burkholderiaceae bacterium]|jgi:negative regulator of sigma E activity